MHPTSPVLAMVRCSAISLIFTYRSLPTSSICVTDCETRLRSALYRPAHAQTCLSVAAHPNNAAVFASASRDGSVLLWDTRQQKPASGRLFV